MQFPRLTRIAAVSAIAMAALSFTAMPAHASTGYVPKPKAINWTITYTQFGKHKLNESVATAQKISGINYKTLLQQKIYRNGSFFCDGPVQLPLVKSGVHKTNVWATVWAPCDTKSKSWSTYVKKHKLYSSLKLTTFTSSEERWNGDYLPNYAYGKYLPHTAKVAIGDTIKDLAYTYVKAHINYDYGITEDDGSYTGPVLVAKSGSKAALKQQIIFYVDHNSVQSITLRYLPSGRLA